MKSCGLNIQMKTTKQYFPVVLLMMLFKVVLTFKSVDDSNWAVLSCGTVYYAAQSGSCFWWSMKSHVVAVQMKPTDQKGGWGGLGNFNKYSKDTTCDQEVFEKLQWFIYAVCKFFMIFGKIIT